MALVLALLVNAGSEDKPVFVSSGAVATGPVHDATYEADAAANIAGTHSLPPGEENLWEYNSETNALGRRILTACIESSNSASLSWPYHPTKAKLCLRQRNGRHDFFLYTEDKSQMICSSYSGCRVPVRYDAAAATSATFYEPSDYDSSYLIANAIPKRILSAKQVVIAPTFYRDGEQALIFDTHGLNPVRIGYAPHFVTASRRHTPTHS